MPLTDSVPTFSIQDTVIAADDVYFIAEAGVNHNGDLDQARELIDVAAESGADAVKFQTFTAERLVVDTAPTAEYQSQTTDADSQHELLRQYELPPEAHRTLQDYCSKRGITFLSTPFDPKSASFLDSIDVPAIKLGSGELTNHPLLRQVATFGRPMIVSTGMGTMAEVDAAVAAIQEANPSVDSALLHCTSAYPAEMATVNLRAMQQMKSRYDLPVGYSDHTRSPETPGLAVAAGARIVEKHFTLDRTLSGPDHHASLEPAELERAVSLAREAAVARGQPSKVPSQQERENRMVVRKSLYACRDVDSGDRLTRDDVVIRRPVEGLPPTALDLVIGRTVKRSLEPEDPITKDVLE